MVNDKKTASPSLLHYHLLMVVCACLVSTSFTVGAAIARDIDPALLTCVRFVLASLLLAPYIHHKFGLACSLSLFLRCGMISAGLVFFFWCMFLALNYTSALNTSVIFTLVPAISGIYAAILVRERLGRPQLIALVVGIAGAVWVIFQGDLSQLLALELNRGDVIFLAGCFGMGLYTPLIKLYHRGESMLLMTFWVLVTGTLWLMPFTLPIFFTMEWTAVPGQAWLGVVYLAVFTTVTTFFLTQYCTPHIGPTRAMSYSYLYPALVLLIDLLCGHGLPPITVLPGIGVVFLAMVVLQLNVSD